MSAAGNNGSGMLDVLADLVAGRIGGPAAPRLAYRIGEAAAALGVSEDYFAQKIAPDLRMVRDGRTKLVSARELERWLEEHSAFALEGRR